MIKIKNKVLWIVGFVVVASVLSLYFDHQIVQFIDLWHNDLLDEIFLGVTFISAEIIIFLILTSLFSYREHKRKWILPLWLTLLSSVILSSILKFAVQRLRPFQQGIVETFPTLMKDNFMTWNFSFPSFQAMIVFAAVPILNKEFPKFKYFWIFFAVLVAFSRVYFGVHFLSDVLLGGLIGFIIGEVFVYMEKEKHTWTRIYERIIYGEK